MADVAADLHKHFQFMAKQLAHELHLVASMKEVTNSPLLLGDLLGQPVAAQQSDHCERTAGRSLMLGVRRRR